MTKDLTQDAALATTQPRRATCFAAALTALTVLLVAANTFNAMVGFDFNHDEHQFIMPGLLLWEGALPYRDYLYYHMPLQAFVYAPLLQLHDNSLLVTRLASAGFALTTLLTLGLWGQRQVPGLFGRMLATTLVALLGTSLVYTHAAGAAWNHTGSVLAALAAFILTLNAAATRDRLGLLALAGVLLGLAVGWRLTMLPLLAPFGLGLLFLGQGWSWPRTLRRTLAFALGVLIALSPVILLAASNPERFYIGNFIYPSFSNAYHRSNNQIWTWGTKAVYFLDDLRASPKHLALLILTLGMLSASLVFRLVGKRLAFTPLLFGLLVTAFVLFGAYMPGRLHMQYNYGPAVFASVLTLLAARHAASFLPVKPWLTAGCAAVTLLALAVTVDNLRPLTQPDTWTHRQASRFAQTLTPYVQGREVATLAPLFVHMAGGHTDPAFATGPFPWRTAPFVPDDLRERLQWAGAETMGPIWQHHPPDAILTGAETARRETSLVALARQLGYQPLTLPRDVMFHDRHPVLWLPPSIDPAAVRTSP